VSKSEPTRFYCNQCERWTTVADVTEEYRRDYPTSFVCSVCGESYECGECGYEIDRDGTCLRPAEMGECPEAVRP
jgi:hypothetical protein